MTPQKKLHLTAALNEKGVRFTGTSDADMDAYYKAYTLGSFKEAGFVDSMTSEYFPFYFAEHLKTLGCISVTFYTKIDGAELPVGVGIFWLRERIVQNENLIWFPWATPRNIIESSINYFDSFRKCSYRDTKEKYKILEFAQEKDVKFFDKLVSLGILDKVGEIPGIYANTLKCFLYVTKEVPKDA